MNNIDSQLPKRSDEPLFWLGFGAGGMWLAIVSPIIILLVGLILPISMAVGAESTVQLILGFFHTLLGKVILLGSIALPLWCGMHRIFHLLYDWKLDAKLNMFITKIFFYGSTVLISLLATYFIFLM